MRIFTCMRHLNRPFTRFRSTLLALATVIALGQGITSAENTDPAAALCRSIAETNLVDATSGWLRPSPSYKDGTWLRDAFWTTGYLGPEVGKASLELFGGNLRIEGQAPTRLSAGRVPDQYFDDESTILYLIWAARDGGQPSDRLTAAWQWIGRHVVEGAYWTPAGNFHTWHDTLVFPEADVAAYNQGLYATATLAARRLGLTDDAEVDAAAAAYRDLYRKQRDNGYLAVSKKLDYRDASALSGEVLARSSFDTSLLEDAMVLNTVRMLPRSGPGFQVLTNRQGMMLSEKTFSQPSVRGDYHNGGSWLLYDVLAWTAARLAGDQKAGVEASRRLSFEVATGTLREYLRTGPAARLGNSAMRSDYAWNSYACVAMNWQPDSNTAFTPAENGRNADGAR